MRATMIVIPFYCFALGCGAAGGGSGGGGGVCGDNKCSGDETSLSCCEDCGCPGGQACVAGACKAAGPTCRHGGEACAATGDCCSQEQLVCQNGQCTQPKTCTGPGLACASNADCCASLACVEGECTGSWSTMSIVVDDSCYNGEAIEYKFFDAGASWVWPDASHHWNIDAGQSLKADLTCRNGNLICVGGNQPQHNLYWGVGFTGSMNCSANVPCCWACAAGTGNYTMSCN